MKKILQILTMCLLTLTLNAQTAQEYLMLGNSSYKKNNYAQAMQNYQNAINQGGNSAELYFNMANACAKLNKKGEALLYYMKAFVQQPRLREAEANLKLFAKDNGIKLPEKSAVEMYLLELSEFEWIIVTMVAFWIMVVLICIPRMYLKKISAYIFLAIIFAIITVVGTIGIVKCNNIRNTAIALTDDVALRLAPTPHAPISSTVQEGTFAKILKRNANFNYVQTPSGKTGWASTSEFAPIDE